MSSWKDTLLYSRFAEFIFVLLGPLVAVLIFLPRGRAPEELVLGSPNRLDVLDAAEASGWTYNYDDILLEAYGNNAARLTVSGNLVRKRNHPAEALFLPLILSNRPAELIDVPIIFDSVQVRTLNYRVAGGSWTLLLAFNPGDHLGIQDSVETEREKKFGSSRIFLQ